MRRKKGFTIVELCIVLSIIAVLSAFLIGEYMNFKEQHEQPETTGYGEILEEYGFDITHLTEEQIQQLVDKLQKGE